MYARVASCTPRLMPRSSLCRVVTSILTEISCLNHRRPPLIYRTIHIGGQLVRSAQSRSHPRAASCHTSPGSPEKHSPPFDSPCPGPSTRTMPSRPASVRKSRSPSPGSTAATATADEVTSLLPSTSRPRSPPSASAQKHARKSSLGARSVAGSVRGYGAVSTRVSPNEQAPRVSKVGQRVSRSCFDIPGMILMPESADDRAHPPRLLPLGRLGVPVLGVDTDPLPQHCARPWRSLPAL